MAHFWESNNDILDYIFELSSNAYCSLFSYKHLLLSRFTRSNCYTNIEANCTECGAGMNGIEKLVLVTDSDPGSSGQRSPDSRVSLASFTLCVGR